MKTGDKIKLLRERAGFTLEQLGKRVGVGKSTVRKWETGAIENMGRDKIEKLAEVFGVSPTYLIKETEEGDHSEIDLQFFGAQKNEPVTLSHDELDVKLIKRLMQLTPEELQKVDAFVQGLLASR